jgi:hypothetical protein
MYELGKAEGVKLSFTVSTFLCVAQRAETEQVELDEPEAGEKQKKRFLLTLQTTRTDTEVSARRRFYT